MYLKICDGSVIGTLENGLQGWVVGGVVQAHLPAGGGGGGGGERASCDRGVINWQPEDQSWLRKWPKKN